MIEQHIPEPLQEARAARRINELKEYEKTMGTDHESVLGYFQRCKVILESGYDVEFAPEEHPELGEPTEVA